MDAISQTIFSKVFSWKQNLYFDKKNSEKFAAKGPIDNSHALV